MAIPIDCSCGERLNLRDELGGQIVRCPGCGRQHDVPWAVTRQLPSDLPPITPPPRRARTQPVPVAPAFPVKLIVFIGGFVGVALISGIILYFVLREDSSEDRPRGEGRFPGAADRTNNHDNLHRIGRAFHEHHNHLGSLPPAASPGPNALSWRVALLPYIDQDDLYRAWNKNEPWDGPNNRQLWSRMPRIYQLPGRQGDGTKTYYQVFVGNGTVFPANRANRGVGFHEISDGLSNTILVAEAGRPVIWCQPTDIPFTESPDGFDPKQVGGYFGKSVNVVMADGSVREISWGLSPLMFQLAITRADGKQLELGD